MTGPPLFVAVDFIVVGIVAMVAGGVVATLVLFWFAWWAPPVLAGGWLATHWLLRESGVWRDRNTPEVRAAQRHADYAYRLAVDPPAAKELRLFGLGSWAVDRFVDGRHLLHELQYRATKLRERSVAGSLVIVLTANVAVFWSIADRVADGGIGIGAAAAFLQAAVAASAIAFGGLSWALDGAAAPVAALGRLETAMAVAGTVPDGNPVRSRSTGARDPVPLRAVRLPDR